MHDLLAVPPSLQRMSSLLLSVRDLPWASEYLNLAGSYLTLLSVKQRPPKSKCSLYKHISEWMNKGWREEKRERKKTWPLGVPRSTAPRRVFSQGTLRGTRDACTAHRAIDIGFMESFAEGFVDMRWGQQGGQGSLSDWSSHMDHHLTASEQDTMSSLCHTAMISLHRTDAHSHTQWWVTAYWLRHTLGHSHGKVGVMVQEWDFFFRGGLRERLLHVPCRRYIRWCKWSPYITLLAALIIQYSAGLWRQ